MLSTLPKPGFELAAHKGAVVWVAGLASFLRVVPLLGCRGQLSRGLPSLQGAHPISDSTGPLRAWSSAKCG